MRLLKSKNGQGSVELLLALPLILFLCFCFSLIFALGSLRLEVLSLTHEFRVCYESTHPPAYCRQQFRQALHALPGSWRLDKVDASYRHLDIRLEHNIPFQQSPWTVRERRL